MAEIQCPVCGHANPEDAETCAVCQARLTPAQSEEELPEWLSSLRGGESGDIYQEDDDPADWPDSEEVADAAAERLSRLGSEAPAPPPESGEAALPVDTGLPQDAELPQNIELPPDADQPVDAGRPPDALTGPDQPDWLQDLLGDSDSKDAGDDLPEPAGDVPDWLQEMAIGGEEESPEPAAEVHPDLPEPSSEMPEWLSELGDPGEEVTPEAAPEPAAEVLPELPPEEEPEPAAPSGEMPDWLEDMVPGGRPEPAAEAEAVPDWLSAMAPGDDAEDEPESAPELAEEALPDWLTSPGDSEDAPEILQAADSETGETQAEEQVPSVPGFELVDPDTGEFDRPEAETPEWLAGFVDELDSEVETPEAAEQESDDWLAGFVDPPEGEAAPEEDEKNILPSWINKPSPADPDYPTPKPKSKSELPPWLGEFEAEEDVPQAEAAGLPEADPGDDEVPDWLTSALGQTEEDSADDLPLDLDSIEPLEEAEAAFAPEEPAAEEESDPGLQEWLSQYDISEAPEPEQAEPEEELPEWLMDVSAVGAAAGAAQQESEEEEIPDWLQELQSKTPELDISGGDEGSLEDETDAEGWLPDAAENPALSILSEAGEFEEDLAPGELPDWLKAMRPIDATEPGVMETGEVDTGSFERVGPLAGLRGVLSAEPTAVQAGRPPSYSVRLQLSDAQQRKADQLSKMVAGETEPGPARRGAILSEQRVLRYIIATLLFLAAIFPLVSTGRLTELPAKPAEMDAVTPLITSLSAESAVLVVFDYQPGMSGEIDAAASGILDHVMLQGARIAAVATHPIGPALGERLVRQVGVNHNYVYGADYVNLGFIPGAATGLQFFASDAQAAAPVGYDDRPFWALVDQAGSSPWSQPALAGVNGLEDFQLTLLLSDDPDTVRRWIEQAGDRMRAGSLIVVASAQAEPLVRPYFDAGNGQVAALVPGLTGGAAYEGFLQREGPARAILDAVGLSTTLALILILGVGSYNLYLAWNERELMRRGNG